MSNVDNENSVSVPQPKSKPQISALEKYGYTNTSKSQTEDNDDDYDDDDFLDDKDDASEDDGITEEEYEATDQALSHPTIHQSYETTTEEEEEEGYEDEEEMDENDEEEGLEDYDSMFDEDSRIAGDWRVVTVHGSEDTSEEEEMEDEELDTNRQRRLSTIIRTKETMIMQYLSLMKHLGRTKRKNLYLQDHLYKLCFRKNLIKEPVEVKKPVTADQKDTARLKRQKKKLDAKMAENYEVFVKSKPPDSWTPETEIKKKNKKPTKGQLNRSRRLVGDMRPPFYSKKLDTKFVSLHGVQYQRVLRSASRNWPKTVEQDETKQDIIKVNKTPEVRKEIPHGIPGAPKHRILVEVIQPVQSKSTMKRKKNETLELHDNPEENILVHSCKGENCQKSKNSMRKRKKSISEIKRSQFERKSQVQNIQSSQIKQEISKEGGDLQENIETVNDGNLDVNDKDVKDQMKRRYSSKKSNVTRRMFAIPKRRFRRKKCKLFRKYNWFERGKVKGRQFSGTKLLSAEKQHLMNFVNLAIITNTSHQRPRKLKNKLQLNETEIGWNDACKRLFLLIIKKEELEKQHKKTMQRKLEEWGISEKRNTLGLDGLLKLFSTFVQQEYFTKAELRKFQSDLEQFGHLLNESHMRLMVQLLKMYKSRLSLLLINRKLKDKTSNQTLSHQGFSIGYYEQLALENKSLYDQIQSREVYLEKQRQKLTSVMKTMVLTRDYKSSMKTSVKNMHYKYRVALEDCQNYRDRALEAMDKLAGIMENNKPLLLQATLVERSNLLHDFSTRKKCLDELDNQKRMIKRRVYLSERELNTIHVKMKNAQRNINEMKDANSVRSKLKELRVHKSAINGKVDNFIAKAVNHCGGTQSEQKSKGSSTKKT